MKSTSKHRTLKKVFLNVTACLTALVVTGSIIANECEVQLNSFLGTSSTKIVTKLPDGVTEEGYVRYYDSKYSTLAELKAAGNAKVREVEGEGIVPFCPVCGEYRFPMYNAAVSMIVVDENTGRILLIQQYGRPSYILVAGYINRGESAEDAVRREILEETGLHAGRIHFNRTRFFEPSNTLMCNFTAFVPDAERIHVNREVDRFRWFSPAEARANIRPNSLAAAFLDAWLNENDL